MSSINSLYTYTIELLLINGNTFSSHIQRRGLRQGCPPYPLLFNLYLNTLLHHIEATITLDPFFSIHAFIDVILVRSTNKKVISDVFSYFDTTARHMGLNMNIKKAELHAMNNAQHTVLSTPFWKRRT